jgi:hypothetical protein
MNVKLLKRICEVPTQTYHEDAMVKFLMDFVSSNESRYGRCWTDQYKNVFIVKGTGQYLPCVAAHIDTVQSLAAVTVREENGRIIAVGAEGQRVGFGADDKSGVFICLELLEQFDNIAVAFFAAEEVGCVGARNADKRFFEQVGYVVEFDCPSWGLMSYTVSGEQLFANHGEFIRTAFPVLQNHGITQWQRHPYTDVMAVRQRFPISCLNLASGYYNWHQVSEYIKLSDTAAMLVAAADIIDVFGPHAYPFNKRHGWATGQTLLEVTQLNVPKDNELCEEPLSHEHGGGI